MAKDRKKLVLLDAHAIIHRAYHALPEFSKSSGEPTGALYGLSAMLIRIITDLKPDYIAACYDLPQKTFRHEAYEAYKGTRAKADAALIAQLKESRKIFDAFSIPIYDAPGFEADDVLGTIIEHEKKNKNLDIVIASGDMDTLQLVDDKRVQVFTLKKGINDTVMYDEEKVMERFGFAPKFLPDYKGLRGDPSDNIVGVKGIGEKTAQALIVNYGTIEDIYKKIKQGDTLEKAKLTPRLLQILKDNEEEAVFSKTLATIRKDAPIKFELPEKNFWQTAQREKVEQVFKEFEFKSLIARLQNFFEKGNGTAKPAEFSRGPEENIEGLRTGLVEPKVTLGPEQNLLDSPASSTELQETSIALWLINSDIGNPGLPEILDYAKTKSFKEAREKIFKKLKEDGLEKVYAEIERPIMPVIREMEDYGILIDQKYFEKLSADYHKELDQITKRIWKAAGTEFNINSPKQLGEVLFQKLGLKSNKKSAGGALSTRVSVLEELAGENMIIDDILAYRELQKLLSTYIDVLPKLVKEDSRLHARFIQNGTTTGRFSSHDPNMQNLPIKSELGKAIRGGFVAAKGSALAAFDYSQIELRVAAMLSGDKKMTALFRDRKDIHAGVASFVFDVPLEKVTSEMRRQAKVINFGIIYGMGVNALRRNLGGTRAEAQKFYDNYFNQFSGLRDYLEEVKVFAKTHKYTETLFGRRRYFPDINSRIPFLRSMAERTATNASLQGTAADIIKLAIRFAHEDLEKAGLLPKAHLIMQVHDELVYEIEAEALEKAAPIIEKAMEDVLERSYLKHKTEVPLEVHSGAGKDLGEVK